ncbi:hypothetical protein [Microbacterium elymi]|uniref:hypothetical protein n=1 Tax=Microbacterium elymi TaxID=2909587 RepID=UPI00338F26CF
MITVEEHRDRILAAVRLLEATTMPVNAALGRFLREPVRSQVDLPLFDNSAMDGFAVRFDDVSAASPDAPVVLEVVADLPAGTSDDPPLRAGQAARIMTGSPVPADADAVVPFEDTVGGLEDSLGRVEVIEHRGHAEPISARVPRSARPGTRSFPPEPSWAAVSSRLAAAAGVTEVVVSRLPRVAVISTGDELRPPAPRCGAARSPSRTARCWRDCASRSAPRWCCAPR